MLNMVHAVTPWFDRLTIRQAHREGDGKAAPVHIAAPEEARKPPPSW